MENELQKKKKKFSLFTHNYNSRQKNNNFVEFTYSSIKKEFLFFYFFSRCFFLGRGGQKIIKRCQMMNEDTN